MSTAAPAPPAGLGSIEALKRVKATENDWELRLRAARGAAEEQLGHLREASDAAVKAAQEAADAERTRLVQAARSEAERAAAEILAEGTRVAEAATRGDRRGPSDRRDAILAAVLAGFAKD